MALSTSTELALRSPGSWTASWLLRTKSLATLLALSPEHNEKLLGNLTPKEALALSYCWEFWARPAQLPPAVKWRIWMILAGRGFGKTRSGSELVIKWAMEGGKKERIALIGATAGDVRDTMIEGESGILMVSPPWFFPHYEPSKRKITWPNGAIAKCYSADKPDRLRGSNNSKAWADELCAWQRLDAWKQLMLTLRLGTPQCIVTTTPRPMPLLKEIIARKGTVLTQGSTYENRENLAEEFFEEIIGQFAGTRLGAQELDATILEDVEGALWTPGLIEKQIWREGGSLPEWVRIVVGVDPATTQGADRDETGIVVAAKDQEGRGFILEDCSLAGSPEEWAREVIQAARRWRADCIVVETNRGGNMCIGTIKLVAKDMGVKLPRIKPVRASDGKVTRAEPYVALYERGLIWHVERFATLESQMSLWVPGVTRKSPDRMDALVWALCELFPATGVLSVSKQRPKGM